MSHFSTPEGSYELRQRLRRSMPEGAFEPEPFRGVVALLQLPLIVALSAVVVSGALPLWAGPLMGFVIGQIVTSQGLIAHETMHRATFRSRALQILVGWLGFCWYFITPGTWHSWHVLGHHGHTQEGEGDPDQLMTLERYRSSRLARWIHAVTPGSRNPISYVSIVFLFTLQAQLFLWHYASLPAFEKVRMNRTRERLGTVALVAAWSTLGWWLGAYNALCVIIIPMLTANATLMMYIASNHWLRPVTPDHNNPFTNTNSVSVPAFLDWLHVSFSYHQEHHIFPQMSPRWAPTLRERLRKAEPAAVVVWPIGAVWHKLFTTPSIYADDHTLVHPDGSGAVTVEEIAAQMEGSEGVAAVAAR